ncbi:YheC/YheD family protein [Aneurinibacillus migulanus]|uniref:YheC/YheD family endospore coat-associated protein n=1 Tax=Aneurinibacillus migulanus TaxID=47500 RepID=UPI002E20B0F2|nr:YheC/YheD family protein [Aneurinibacillus migulanus]
MTTNQPLIGVLTHRRGAFIAGKTYLTSLATVARTYGCRLIVYSPSDIYEEKGIVNGFIYNDEMKAWQSRKTRLPDIVYDRFSNMTPEIFKKYAAYRKISRLRYLNNRFAHKWNAHRFFSRNPELVPHLPDTVPMQQGVLERMIKKYPMLYVKPVNGSGGRGILRIRRGKNVLEMVGRDRKGCVIHNSITSLSAAERFLLLWCQKQGRSFIMQQGLMLTLLPDSICDSRILVQKNEQNEWHITGMIGKQSPEAFVTSNLQSGGQAIVLEELLCHRFSTEERERIVTDIERISLILPRYIESKFGDFIEFGIDIGIDTKGRVWIIEVNTKPNRELFRLAGQFDVYQNAIEMPVRVAATRFHTTDCYPF